MIAVHLGVACVVIGYATTNVFQKEATVIIQDGGGTVNATSGEAAFGYRFVLTNISKNGNAGASPTEYWDKFDAKYDMFDASGRLVRSGESFIVYKRPGPEPSPDNFAFTNYIGVPIIRTDVFTTPFFDLYIQLNNMLPGRTNGSVAVELSVKQIPGIWAVWGGVGMMVGGMVTLMAVEYSPRTRQGGEKFIPADDPQGTPAKLPSGGPHMELPSPPDAAPGK